MFRERRKFLKNVGTTGIAGFTVGNGLTSNVLADPVDGSDFPKNHTQDSQIQRSEYGYDYQYTTSVGSHLDLLDSYFWPDSDHWQYNYHTAAGASNNKKLVGSSGDGSKVDLFDGDHVIDITEYDAPDQVSTGYFGNADWGLGVSDDTQNNYSWGAATVDTLWALINRFDPLVSSVTTASNIHSYWKRAGKDGEVNDGIRHEWNRYARAKTAGHFMRFFVAFPPRERMSVDYVDMNVRNTIRNTLFENNGDNVPTYDYTMSWGLTHAVLSRPSTASSAERKKYGISKKRVKDVPALAKLPDVDPTEVVYVMKNPPVRVEALE